jgi:uncharacterized membrane protein
MGNHLHNELRKEFQLERIILFSDAVFAIAITLLVIEIKIPEIKETELTEHALLHALGLLIPKFIGFLISFLIIGQYWITHHRMFGFVINFSDRLIWLNIIFLLGIALMPFSTGFYSQYADRNVFSPVIFYTANIAMLGIVNFFMWRYISKPKNKISENLTAPLVTYFVLRAVTVPGIFIIFSFVYFYNPDIGVWIPGIIPFVMRFIYSSMKKKILIAQKQ